METEESEQREAAADEPAVGKGEGEGEGEGGEEVDRLSSQRVSQLSRFLRQQQEVVYKQDNISKCFSADVQKVAAKCWGQIHPNISMAIEGKYGRVLEEWSVVEKLSELDRQRSEHAASSPAWRPTGIPAEDSLTAESAEAKKVLPDFQKTLTKAQAVSRDLQQRQLEREEVVARLEQELRTSLDTLTQTTASYLQPH